MYTLMDVWENTIDVLRKKKNEKRIVINSLKYGGKYEILHYENVNNPNKINILLPCGNDDLKEKLCEDNRAGQLLKNEMKGGRGTERALAEYLGWLTEEIRIHDGLDGLLDEHAARYRKIMENSIRAKRLDKVTQQDSYELKDIEKYSCAPGEIYILEDELCKCLNKFLNNFPAEKALELVDGLQIVHHANVWKCLAVIVFYALLDIGSICVEECGLLKYTMEEFARVKSARSEVIEKLSGTVSSEAEAIRYLNYRDMLDLGFDSLSICQKLVDNDNLLYKLGTGHPNEGTPELWARFLEGNPENFLFAVKGREIVGNYSFAIINSNQVAALGRGELYEADFSIAKNSLIFAAGIYTLYLLNFSFNQGYNFRENYVKLWSCFVKQLEKYAILHGVYFRKIYVNAFRDDHEEIYKQLGFDFVAKNKIAGTVYGLERFPENMEWQDKEHLTRLYDEMYEKLRMRIEYRQLTEQDKNRRKCSDIAELIYDTDPYIYPAMFRTKIDAVKVLKEVFKLDTDEMFSVKNIFAAIDNGRVIGIILWYKGCLEWNEGVVKSISHKLHVDLADTFDMVCENYFCSYNNIELDKMVSLINVCVAEKYRAMGIAQTMLQEFLKTLPQGEKYELYSLEENETAIQLYERVGFCIVSRHKAFTISGDDIYAVKMIKE